MESHQHMTKIGVLGCGNIGRIIANRHANVHIVAVCDQHARRAHEIASRIGAKPYTDFSSFIQEEFAILVEAASIEAVLNFGEQTLRAGKDFIPLSVGAFADAPFKQRMVKLASESGRTIRIPSGALFGLDNLKIARLSKVDRLRLRTVKSPASLNVEVKEKRRLFKGTAAECIRHYPRNVNVAVSLSLAAGREVDVELWVDPAAERNRHEVLFAGEFGETNLVVNNLPCPDNPSTSFLAALSILTLLADLDNPMVVGT